ncbi:Protein srek1IP1 [Dispira simplex]|nr:Protein srek1IP1 [Dispira simplex]
MANRLAGTMLGDRVLIITQEGTPITAAGIPLPGLVGKDPAQLEEISRTVYVGNLDSRTPPQRLQEFMETVGPVAHLKLAGDGSQLTRFAFVEYVDQATAQKALAMTGAMFAGRPLKINPSKSTINKPIPMSPGVNPNTSFSDVLDKVREAQRLVTQKYVQGGHSNGYDRSGHSRSRSRLAADRDRSSRDSSTRRRHRDYSGERSRPRRSYRSRSRSQSRRRYNQYRSSRRSRYSSRSPTPSGHSRHSYDRRHRGRDYGNDYGDRDDVDSYRRESSHRRRRYSRDADRDNVRVVARPEKPRDLSDEEENQAMLIRRAVRELALASSQRKAPAEPAQDK